MLERSYGASCAKLPKDLVFSTHGDELMAIFDLPPDTQVFERGWLSANNILFTGGEQSVLIDSGYCTHSDQTLALVEAALHG